MYIVAQENYTISKMSESHIVYLHRFSLAYIIYSDTFGQPKLFNKRGFQKIMSSPTSEVSFHSQVDRLLQTETRAEKKTTMADDPLKIKIQKG